MAKFLVYGIGYEHLSKQVAATGRCDRWTKGKKWGWCQPQPGASKAQAFEAPAFTFRVFLGVLNPHIMGLEELVKLEAGLNS